MTATDFLGIPLCVVLLLVTGCAIDTRKTGDDSVANKELADVRQQTIRLADRLGVPPEQARRCSTSELLVDIELKLNGDNEYLGPVLSEKEMITLTRYLNTEHKIFDIIKQYHRYINKTRTQRVIVIPKKVE